MTLLELIDALIDSARDLPRDAHDDESRYGDALQQHNGMRAEIERRLKLAKADHSLMWDCHLDDNERSQGRQRKLIARHAADVAAGRRPSGIVEYCRKDL